MKLNLPSCCDGTEGCGSVPAFCFFTMLCTFEIVSGLCELKESALVSVNKGLFSKP